MGTGIQLTVGNFPVDYGKNFYFDDHTALFQDVDLKRVPDEGYEDGRLTEAYSRSLRSTVSRLELLGFTMARAKREYSENLNEYGEKIRRPMSFKKFSSLVQSIDLGWFTGEWTENPGSASVPAEIIAKFKSDKYDFHQHPDYWFLDVILEGLSTYTKLRLLAENEKNLDQSVHWVFGPIVEEGYAKRDEFITKLGKSDQFLIVTEGSSDSKIIKKALSLLRPQEADFFTFIDMAEGYPFTGTGNLFKFCQGLVRIGVLNRVVILYDNDTEGLSKYLATKKLALPDNMAAAKLPDIVALKKFPTIGPHRQRKENINGSAASIECYLDLSFGRNGKPPVVRWTSYYEPMGQYQGSLEDKNVYTKSFLDLRHRDPKYDFSKIEFVLDHLHAICMRMKSS